MRPVFCGNFDYETRHSDLDRLFSRYGRVDRIDMKSGIIPYFASFPPLFCAYLLIIYRASKITFRVKGKVHTFVCSLVDGDLDNCSFVVQ